MIRPPLPIVSHKRRRAGCAMAPLILVIISISPVPSHPSGRPRRVRRGGAAWDSEGRRPRLVAGTAHRLDQRLDARTGRIVLHLALAGVEADFGLVDARH